VIAIIAILAAILFPVFAQAREKARGAACLSNVKQLSLGIHMYTQDHDEYLPYGYICVPSDTCADWYWWQDQIRPYVKNEQVYTCPSSGQHTVDYGGANGRPGMPTPLMLDYVNNAAWGFEDGDVFGGVNFSRYAGATNGPFINNWGNPARSIAEVEDPAGTIALFDARTGYIEVWRHRQTDAYYNATGKCAWSWNDPNPTDPEICREGHVDKRHTSGFTAGFIDGHAKWIRNSTPGQWSNRAND
jgi:prepilin-type processing-associated H-X9-DG protein